MEDLETLTGLVIAVWMLFTHYRIKRIEREVHELKLNEIRNIKRVAP